MKKAWLVIVIMVFSTVGSLAVEVALDELRKEFYKITLDSKNAPKLLDKLYRVENPDGIVLGYTAATEAIMAKHVWNPYSKIKYLYKSKKTFTYAIELNQNNPEIRFLRFAVQHHLPKYLGFSKDMLDDKNTIMMSLSENNTIDIDESMINYIMDFMIKSDQCTNEEIATIRKSLTQL